MLLNKIIDTPKGTTIMTVQDIFQQLLQNKTVELVPLDRDSLNNLLGTLRSYKSRYVKQLESAGLLGDTNIQHKTIQYKTLSTNGNIQLFLDFPPIKQAIYYQVVGNREGFGEDSNDGITNEKLNG